MKIAVACEIDTVPQSLENTQNFAIFELEDDAKRILGMLVQPLENNVPATFLSERSVKTLLCGKAEDAIKKTLEDAGIKVVEGFSGDTIEALGEYLLGRHGQ